MKGPFCIPVLIIGIILGFVIITGCSGSDKSTSQNCIIGDNQTGHIEIINFQYYNKGQPGGEGITGRGVKGTAKNVGTNTISGTIDFIYYLEDSVPWITFRSNNFCNIQPNQEFKFTIPNIELTSTDNDRWETGEVSYWCIKAGQKIITTGEGPRENPYKKYNISSVTCDCSYDRYNCSDFSIHAEAQACYNYCISLGKGDIHSLDLNGNGNSCEDLPLKY